MPTMKKVATVLALFALSLSSTSCGSANASEPPSSPPNNPMQGTGSQQRVSFYADDQVSSQGPNGLLIGTTPASGTFVLTDVVVDYGSVLIYANGVPVFRFPKRERSTTGGVALSSPVTSLKSGIPIPAGSTLTATNSNEGITLTGYIEQ